MREAIAEKLAPLVAFLPSQTAAGESTPEETTRDARSSEPVTDPPRREKDTGASSSSQSLRVRIDLLDNLMNLTGELVLSRNRIKRSLMEKLSSGMARSPELNRLRKQLASSRESLDAAARTSGNGGADAFAELVEREFNNINAALRQLLDGTFSDLPLLNGAMLDIDGVTSELQGGVMGTRMQLVGTVFSKFPRLIRDLSRKLGKEIELVIQGENVELDKSIIEALGDPLTHLIRNCADHGIETPEERKAAGKAAQGHVELSARHEGGQVVIEIVDDGGGIDPERIKQKAIERDMISPNDADQMSDREALRLILAPGFSTAEQVSDVSGRGVGMDVVRSNIEKIGGTVDIESKLGQGTRVTLKLPLTLAVMPALILENEDRVFAIPQVDIEELVRIRARDVPRRIESIHGRPVMRLREKVLPLIRLNDALGIESTYVDATGTRHAERRTGILDRRATELDSGAISRETSDRAANASCESESKRKQAEDDRRRDASDRRRNLRNALNIIVLRVGANPYGLVVETLRDNEEIVVKPLPAYLKKCPFYAGTTIMGDGRVAMILDAAGMATTARLRFGGDLERIESALSEGKDGDGIREKQSLLLFRSGTSEHFAINLSMVKRIERVDRGAVEWIDDKEYLKYEDATMRLIRLHDYLPVKRPESDDDELFVIVPKLVSKRVGICASRVEDILETDARLDRETITGTGVLGSIVAGGDLIICLEVYGLLEAAEPTMYQETGAGEELRGKRVLLAEDTEFFRIVVSTYLREIGCEMDVAKDGEEAWSMLNASDYDLLVTDIQMPKLDGLELTALVRSSRKHTGLPVVALTSMVHESDRKRILDAGVDAFEAKFDKEGLRTTLKALVPR